MMSKKLADGTAYEFPLFLSLADDGGSYYRANVNHQYDYMLVASDVDEQSPCRAICKAVFAAMEKLCGDDTWDKPRWWQMWRKEDTPKVGVGVILLDDQSRLLLLRRKGAHGEGQWSLPGGHMQLGECFDGVCKREVKEETDISITGVSPVYFTNDVFEEEGLHYVTLFFRAHWDPSVWKPRARIVEPDRTAGMDWFERRCLPAPLFSPLAEMIERKGLIFDGLE